MRRGKGLRQTRPFPTDTRPQVVISENSNPNDIAEWLALPNREVLVIVATKVTEFVRHCYDLVKNSGRMVIMFSCPDAVKQELMRN